MTLSAIQILLAENKMDQFANEVCSLALGAAGAAIGTSIGVFGGPLGMIIGAGIGGVLGGLMGDWAHGKIKEWLFTEGEDGVRPIDRIADKFRAATNILNAVAEVLKMIMRGQADVLGALLEHWRRRGGGLGGGSG
jgi:phage tail tape-measure protein